MKTITPTDAVNSILEADEEEKHPRMQGAMDTAYKRWQKGGDLENVGKNDFLKALEDPFRMAVAFGNLNYQVENGGFSQWFFNDYGDNAMPYLVDYLSEYADGNYPAMGRLNAMLRTIQEDILEGESYSDWSRERERKGERLEAAIYDEDWDEVYDILGGTDLDRRFYERMLDEEVANAEVETYQAEDGWSYRLTFEGQTIYDYGSDGVFKELFGTEEEAEEDSEKVTFNDLDEDGQGTISEYVKGELSQEYGRYVGDESDPFDQLDSEYYTFNQDLLGEIETIINEKWPDSLSGKVGRFLKKAWANVQAKAKGAAQSVTKTVDRVKKAGQAAVDTFKANESLEADELLPSPKDD